MDELAAPVTASDDSIFALAHLASDGPRRCQTLLRDRHPPSIAQRKMTLLAACPRIFSVPPVRPVKATSSIPCGGRSSASNQAGIETCSGGVFSPKAASAQFRFG